VALNIWIGLFAVLMITSAAAALIVSFGDDRN
jgi:hypothetical protein